MPRTIWGERRFFVPGIVMLTILAITAALSGCFGELEQSETEAGLAAIAAIAAGGLAGYPLGVILYAPFAFFFRLAGNYNRYVDYHRLCGELHSICSVEKVCSGGHLESLRARSLAALGHSDAERILLGYLYERFAPDAVRGPSRGRWETYHTIGGMVIAIVFALVVSVPVVLVAPHRTPWWDHGPVLMALTLMSAFVLLLLVVHANAIAKEAAAMETQWSDLLLDLVRSNPELMEIAPVNERFDGSALVRFKDVTSVS